MEALTGTAGPVPLADRPAGIPAPRTRKGSVRPVPQRSAGLAHLSLEQLRAYRGALAGEEGRVSYWRRILQARLDVVRAGTIGREVEAGLLKPVLTADWVASGRRAFVDVVPTDDIPPLPRLDELWERRVHVDDVAGQAVLDADLTAAEQQLSVYRTALHRQIGDATGELIARYRDSPALCLSALPLRPQASPRRRA